MRMAGVHTCTKILTGTAGESVAPVVTVPPAYRVMFSKCNAEIKGIVNKCKDVFNL